MQDYPDNDILAQDGDLVSTAVAAALELRQMVDSDLKRDAVRELYHMEDLIMENPDKMHDYRQRLSIAFSEGKDPGTFLR